MSILYLIISFFLIADSLTVSEKTAVQVQYYVNELQNKKDEQLYIWALGEIASVDCEHLALVKKNVELLKDTHYKNQFNSISCDDLTSDVFDMSDHIVSYFPKDYQSKLNVLITDKSKSISDILPYNEYHLIHFILLMNSDHSRLYSKEYLDEAVDVWADYLSSKSEHDLEYSIVISNIIRASFLLQNDSIVERYSSEFLNNNLLPNSFHKLRLYGLIDFTYYIFGQYDKSLKLQREYSLPLATFLDLEKQTEDIKSKQGAYLFSLGKYHESIKVYEELYRGHDTFENQYELFTNLGINYLKIGESSKYLNFQLRALDQNIDKYKSELTIYRNLMTYYTSIKDVNSVLEYFKKAKELASQEKDSTELALIDLYLSEFYQTAYLDYSKALEYLDSAEKDINADTQYGMYTDLILEKGYILLKIDSLNAARRVFEEAKKLTLSKSDTPNYIDALVNLAAINLKNNQIDQAAANLEEISLYPRDNLDFELLVKYFTVKADFLSKSNDNRQAIEEIQPVITQVIDRAKNNTDSQQGFWTIQDEYLDAFQLALTLYLEENELQNALTTLEQFKTINDASLYNSPLVKANKLTEEDLAEEKLLSERLQNLRNKYLNASDSDRFEIKRQMDQVSAQREQILSKVELNKESSLPSLWKLQRSINSNELVLHFTEIGDQLYVSQVTMNDIKIKSLPFDIEDKERFNAVADDLASGFTDLEDLHELYNFLNLEIPKQTELITVIPDNYLYRIPLEVLPTRSPDSPISYGSTRYMLEDHHFRYFTSLKEFDSNRRSSTKELTNDFAAFSISNFEDFTINDLPTLPYATVESNNIERALTTLNRKEVYNGNEATKEAFKHSVEHSRLVHVATHSEVSEQNPLFSTIYLKNSDADANLDSEQALYAYELFDTPLNSEFIMLNSCSSGSGNYIQGSGIMGISRALRYAGAKSLALNLWSVNDKIASEFATDLYSYLNEGHTKSESIRMAKLNQLRSANANPHFWGAYMMIGNPSPITQKNDGLLFIVSLLALSTVFLGYSAYQKSSS